MNLNLVKELEIKNPYVMLKGLLKLNGYSFDLYDLDSEGKIKGKSNLTVEDKIKKAAILMPYLEKYEMSEEVNEKEMEVEAYGSLKYDEVSNGYYFKDGDSIFPISNDDLNKVSYMLLKDENSLKSTEEYIEEVKDHITEVREQLSNDFNVDCSEVKPSEDLFGLWFADYFNLRKKSNRGGDYPCGIPYEIITKVSNKLREDSFFEGRGYDSDCEMEIFNTYASNAICYSKSDEFKHSPFNSLFQKFSSELDNDNLKGRIPGFGKSSDMAAELVSNLNYILYRYYNDGDLAEDLLNETNCLTAVNVFTYLINMSSYNLAIFTAFYQVAMSKIFAFGCSKNRNEIEALDWNKFKSSDIENISRHYGPTLQSEGIKKVLNKELDKDDNFYDYIQLFSSYDIEFMLDSCVAALFAIFELLEVYPDWLKDEEVVDLRSKFIYSRKDRYDRYDW